MQSNSVVALPRAEYFGCDTARSRVIRLWHCQEQSNSVVRLLGAK